MGEEREPACHLRPPRVCLHLAHPSMYGTTCPYLPFGCQPSRQCVVSMRRTSRLFLMYTARPARRGRRIHAVRELWQGNRPARTKMPLRWQDVANMRSPGACRWQNARKMRSPGVRRWRDCALMRSWPDWQWQYTRAMRSRVPCRDKIPPRCVPECLAVARFHHCAFPGACRWQNAREMRSRAAIRGKFCASCIPKVASDGKIASSRQDSRAMHPKTGWLWQDMRAMHPKSPANRLSGTHGAKILPGRGLLSLRRPLESCTARESCHPLTTDLSEKRYLR